MPLSNQITVNLIENWEKIIFDFLTDKGHKIPAYEDKIKIGIYYHNLINMHISPQPRKVHISKEFICPKKYKKRVLKLKKRIETGEDITPYLSKGANRIRNLDHLLYDWNIHHLHLGEHREGKSFSERTEELLFIYTTDKAIYFLSVLDHNSFENKELLSIIHNNWPHLIERFLFKGAIEVNQKFSADEISKLRKGGVLALIELDNGKVYMPPGMGVVTTAESAKAVHSTQHILNHLSWIQREIKKYPDNFKEDIVNHTGKMVDSLNVELKIINGDFFIYETQSRYMQFMFHSKDYEEIN